MPAPQITRIDIEKELKAIEAGECPNCRIGATHMKRFECENTPAFDRMAVCNMSHVYMPNWFELCPICFPEKIKKS